MMSLTNHAHIAQLNVYVHIHSDCAEWMTFWQNRMKCRTNPTSNGQTDKHKCTVNMQFIIILTQILTVFRLTVIGHIIALLFE